ncbi:MULTISPECIES: LysE family translocator [Streptomyces]|uniref:LysE family translocator n=2 Tax=Streptomyces nigrescens TaxID=1920 RepID=A0A640TTD9_STRNI|nr:MULTISPECIES: LysE family translocator [Streptomyces]WAU01400.1 LysE family translocator [Streptomyces libani subsp. libani]WAU09264.1 LysE family translocator [Streptomyces nigrescens]WDT52746.1 LysE family translocator [Streptomyces sp. G7(2002)]GFE27323.1 lysine transporter LysE [Streptomyces libani subsp. libani]GGV96459.1 lysine transporter LysE [Streptomyces libani subsp. libani]
MVSTESILAFAAMSLLVIVIPGPSVLFVIGRALAHGRRTALATVLGNLVGSYALVVAVAWGLGALVESSAAVFMGVKMAGAAYLVYLGVQAFRHRKEMRAANMEAPAGEPRGDLRTILDGIFVGVTNPKGIVFFAAVLPQFVDHSAGHVPLQMMVLGLVPVAIGLITDTLWGLGASAARSWFARSDRRLSMVGGAGGFAMIGLGVTVAATGRAD